MAKTNYEDLISSVIDLVGGKDNISSFTHCVTRLRFTIKDKSLVNEDEISKKEGVIGLQWLGGQLQLIIGQNVSEVYNQICEKNGLQVLEAIDENLDEEKKKGFSLKGIGNAILGYLSPTMTGIIPIMIAACMYKTVLSIFGPDVLNIIKADSDLYLVLDMMYDAFFYFTPIFLGYSAAKTLNIPHTYGIYVGALIIVPDFINLVGTRDTLSVFGISSPVSDYSSSFLPVILGVLILSFIVKGLNKVIPDAIKDIFVPTLSLLIITPIMFVVCAPLGTYIGNVVGNILIAMSESNVIIRIIAAILVSVLMPYLVLGGMHGGLLSFALTIYASAGYETLILPAMTAYNFAVFGVALGAFIKLKKPENKSKVITYFASGILGSVTEPCLYGVIMKYRDTMKALLVSCVAFGLMIGIFQPIYYTMSSATIFTFFVPWVGGTTSNLILGCLVIAVAFFGGTIAALFVKYDED